MTKCPTCGSYVEKHEENCPYCGHAVDNKLRCPKCGSANIEINPKTKKLGILGLVILSITTPRVQFREEVDRWNEAVERTELFVSAKIAAKSSS